MLEELHGCPARRGPSRTPSKSFSHDTGRLSLTCSRGHLESLAPTTVSSPSGMSLAGSRHCAILRWKWSRLYSPEEMTFGREQGLPDTCLRVKTGSSTPSQISAMISSGSIIFWENWLMPAELKREGYELENVFHILKQ